MTHFFYFLTGGLKKCFIRRRNLLRDHLFFRLFQIIGSTGLFSEKNLSTEILFENRMTNSRSQSGFQAWSYSNKKNRLIVLLRKIILIFLWDLLSVNFFNELIDLLTAFVLFLSNRLLFKLILASPTEDMAKCFVHFTISPFFTAFHYFGNKIVYVCHCCGFEVFHTFPEFEVTSFALHLIFFKKLPIQV